MKNNYSFRYFMLFALLLSSNWLIGQTPDKFVRCITTEVYAKKAVNYATEEDVATPKTRVKAPSKVYTIPVVFHIIHADLDKTPAVGEEDKNIPYEYVQAQLDQLNADFRKTNSDRNVLLAEFQPLHADVEIQFCMALVDPSGATLTEPGVDRVYHLDKELAPPPYSGLGSDGYLEPVLKPATIWDPTKYFNIWLLEFADPVLGYAQFPEGSGLAGMPTTPQEPTTDGVVCLTSSAGSVAKPNPKNASYGLGRTATHEVGHWVGLRHIWGDGTCASDFANDTPPHNASNSGCPARPHLSTCTPPTEEMFENYMDYSHDRCLVAFTEDQKTRVQTVMGVSPRRKELEFSTVCNIITDPTIAFAAPILITTEGETPLTTVGCKKYKDYSINVNIARAATGAATVTIQRRTAGSTATDLQDYELLTPALTYAAGNNTPKTVNIRVYDDAATEGDEKVFFDLVISGTGVVAGPGNQSLELVIKDNDAAPVIGVGSELLNEAFTTTTGSVLPAGWLAQQVSPPTAPVSNNIWITGTQGGTGTTGRSAYIGINAPVQTGLAEYNSANGADVRLVTPAMVGTSGMRLSFKYRVAGEAGFDFGTLECSTDNGVNFVTFGATMQGSPTIQTVDIPLPSFLSTSPAFKLGFHWVNDDVAGTSPGLVIDDVRVYTTAKEVANTVESSTPVNLGPNEDVYFYGASGNVIARVENMSNHDYGCTTVELDRAGTTAETFWTNKTLVSIMQK